MKRQLSVVVLFMLATSGVAWAETHFEEVWDCEVREGKSLDDLEAVNKSWIKWINGEVKGGGIDSRMVIPVVGDFGGFLFVDSFPTLEAWSQGKDAMQTAKGKEFEAKFDALSDCSSNRLYVSRG